MARPASGYEQNLRAKFSVDDSGGCWVWAGHKPKSGYASFVYKQDGKCKSKTAHRAVYELLLGEIPEGLVLDHLCKNKFCVNPAHLEAVTQAENLRRSDNYIGVNARKTHCLNGHELSGDNVYYPPKKPTHRYCKSCANARSEKYSEARK